MQLAIAQGKIISFPFRLMMPSAKDIIKKTSEKGDATFDPTHNPNPIHFAGIGKEKGDVSFDPMNKSNVGNISFALENPF